MDLPLNALRAFAVSARHLNFARAADELHLSPTAVSQHVKNLEARYGVRLFHRLPRGLALTDEGRAILPAVAASFERLAESLQQLKDGRPRETLTLGVVATYAVGWLLPRLAQFQSACPHVDLRLQTHNNRVDLAGEGLDCRDSLWRRSLARNRSAAADERSVGSDVFAASSRALQGTARSVCRAAVTFVPQ
jgi:LysR family transcriptional regulator of beta-lactamase